VSLTERTPYNHPLDVLRRFMPSPLEALIEFEKELILVETNDSSFLVPGILRESQAHSQASQTFKWKLLRDADVLGKIAEATIIVSESLVVVSMGPACLAGVDPERKELLAFVGGTVDTQEYQDSVLPVLGGLTQFAMGKKHMMDISFPGDIVRGTAHNA